MDSKRLIKIMVIIFACINSLAVAVSKNSSDFAFKYEGDLLPSDAAVTPRWERGFSGGNDYETYYCSAGNGIFTLDTAKGPSATEGAYYAMPGEYSDYALEFYGFPDPTNPWNISFDSGYTVEAKFKIDAMQILNDPNYKAKFCFWLYLEEGLHGQSNCIQVWPDKITAANSNTPDVLYTGNLTDGFHVLRIVRNPGAVEVVQNVYDMYLDGALIANDYASPVTAAYNQDSFLFGDAAGMSGGTDVKVEIDYIRFDLTGAYTPSYVISDINEDRQTDFIDFAALAEVWLLSSDPQVTGYIDCMNPANADVCQ
jgi:hypothetical protein